ncbi:MAG: ATP-binding protein [Nostoc sp. ChiQUE01a]|nr:ATP-binding protein [Nostoc sp. ChiQUE01a]
MAIESPSQALNILATVLGGLLVVGLISAWRQLQMYEEIRDMFTTKPVGKGIGLGMAIAYQIVVERHAGSIGVDSTPGRETEFTIRIPLTSKK